MSTAFQSFRTKGLLGLLTVLLVCSLSAPSPARASNGGVSDGGGGPFEIAAQPFPDAELLDEAVQILRDKVQQSLYPEDLNQQILSELNFLQITRQLLYLPMLIILGNGTGGPQGYQQPADLGRFVTLGAMTKLQPGAPIFFSERVLKDTPDNLAQLLLHETLHHVLGEVSADETYVDLLTRSLFASEYSHSLALGFTHGIAIRDGFISLRGIVLEAIKRVASRSKIRLARMPYSASVIEGILAVTPEIPGETNAWSMSEEDVAQLVRDRIWNAAASDRMVTLLLDPLMVSLSIEIEVIQNQIFSAALQQIELFARELGAQSEWLEKPRIPGCKTKPRFWQNCKEQIFMKDLFGPAALIQDGN